MELGIPNKEIRFFFIRQWREWFRAEIRKDRGRLENFCQAFLENNVTLIEEGFTAYLKKTISIRDTGVKKEMKENMIFIFLKPASFTQLFNQLDAFSHR